MESSKIIGVVRECKNKWERRTPITPKEVKFLVEKGIRVIFQPSTNRCFTEKELTDAGAEFQEDLSEANLILGVKEVPIENLIPNKTYIFFSHTIKAQDYNMPLLDALLEKKIRLIDYECIREDGQRLVAFGRYAGIAGVVDFFRGIGEFLLEKQYQTFFVNVGSSYMYTDLEDIKQSITRVGKNIEKKGLPKEFAPYVFGVTSTGRVAKGACEILELLPHEYVKAEDLDTIPKDENTKIYITMLTPKELVEKLDEDGEDFDKEHYYNHPGDYKSKFHTYYDKISFLVNCMYWEGKYPRVIYEKELIEATKSENMKFLGFTDISADYEGSIEITREFSDIENPYNLYSPKTKKLKPGFKEYEEGDIFYHCVDHLPAEMPLEASMHFGDKLCPFLEELASSDPLTPYEDINDIPDVMKQAIECCNGKLTPNYEYIAQLRALNERQKREESEILKLKKDSKGLKQSISFISLCLSGHLFDTKFFNNVLDALENSKANFQVSNIKVGQRENEKSTAIIQIYGTNVELFNKAIEEIYELSQGLDVEIEKAQGNELGAKAEDDFDY